MIMDKQCKYGQFRAAASSTGNIIVPMYFFLLSPRAVSVVQSVIADTLTITQEFYELLMLQFKEKCLSDLTFSLIRSD